MLVSQVTGEKMLTLTRKIEETIVIGEGEEKIEVTVKEIRRNQVRLGVQAPAHVKIFRKELFERNARGKQSVLTIPNAESKAKKPTSGS